MNELVRFITDAAVGFFDDIVEAIRVLLARIVAAVIITAFVVYAFIHNNDVLRPVPAWGTVALVPIVGVVIFWFRARFRLVYGLTEFGVGAVTAIRVFWPQFNYATVGLANALQVLGGLYIMVRGCENIGKGLPAEQRAKWNRAFPS